LRNIILRVGRFVVYVLLNISLLYLKPLLRRFRAFDFMLLIYPGTREDIISYLLFDKLRSCIPVISVVGLVQKGEKTGRGLVLISKYSAEEILNRKAQEFLKLAKELGNSLGVKKIALAGRLSHLLTQTNDSLFITGKKGTVFAILESVRKTMNEKALPYSHTKIGILGIGFVGRAVLRHLQTFGFATVIGVDLRFKSLRIKDQQRVKMGPNFSLLSECDLVVVLSPQGDDIKEAIPYLKQGVVVLDETYPPISKRNLGRIQSKGEVYKVVLELKGVRFFPHLPKFKNKWLPGCVIEALLVSNSVKNWRSQNEFNKIASEMGLEAFPVRPKSES